jgi:ABC-type glycerol-3-phosphate transport system substrate-binding protein
MSVQFDWQVDGERSGGVAPRRRPPLKRTLLLLALLLPLLAGWGIQRAAQRRAEMGRARQAIQATLASERQALQSGDLEQLAEARAGNSAWLSAALLPANRAALLAGLEVEAVERHGDILWATLVWRSDGGPSWRQVAFFDEQDGRLRHLPSDPAYWGPWRESAQPWGVLVYPAVDAPFAPDIAAFVTDRLADNCPSGCPASAGLTLTIAPDFDQSALPARLRLPSPRLLALDENQAPAEPFWLRLGQLIDSYLAPPVVRFGVPRSLEPRYAPIAAAFMALHPSILVEVVGLNIEEAALPTILPTARLDAVAWSPTAEMISDGLALDLTDYAATDPGFDRADFYPQIWPAAWHRDRLWQMPLAAEMRLIFFDIPAYRAAGLAAPHPGWGWPQLAADAVTLVGRQPDDYLRWTFIDPGFDALYAYAFQWQNDCREVACWSPLEPTAVAAALEWYSQMAGQPGQMPDLTAMEPAERELAVLNWVAPRRAAIWVERPINFELHLLRQPMGVAPLPAADGPPVTPLWLQGAFILQSSTQPLATWEWLKYLSYQSVEKEVRRIPARSSVAAENGFWETLPRPMAEVMSAAFPAARPVTLAEQGLFSWEQLAAVISGRLTPAEAAARPANR